jgi:D-3-phosphoglycerate dehydrogenase / 2-oxoglutarate reductase
MPEVLVSENVAGEEMETLKRSFDVAFEPDLFKSPEKIRRIIPDFQALIVRNQTPVTAELISAGKRLQVIGRAGVGLDNVDAAAATDAGIVIAFTPDQNSVSVAELTIGLMLSLARMIPSADRSTKAGKWERQRFVGVELAGKTLGVVGLGRIGLLTATRAKAFGMNIVAHDSFIEVDSPQVVESGARLVPLDDLLATADVVSCHLPKTPQTVKLFHYERFSRMKPSATFINTSRGEVVDEAGLVRALREKRVAGAALDVRATEPPPDGGGELARMDDVILTPHIAAFTTEGQKRVVASVCSDVAAVLRGGEAKSYFNFARLRKQMISAD